LPEPEGERKIVTRVDRDDSVALQQQAARVQPQTPQFQSDTGVKLQKDSAEGVKVVAKGSSRRIAGADELAQQYQQKLEQVDKNAAVVSKPVAMGRGGGEPVVLVGLAVDFPLRGTAFHFTTPRGEVSVTARSISSAFLKRLTRLGLILFAVVTFALTYRLAMRVDAVALLGHTGSVALIVLGASSIVTGLLPVVGVLAVIGGLTVFKKTREIRIAPSR
jgi:hypothetical protein